MQRIQRNIAILLSVIVSAFIGCSRSEVPQATLWPDGSWVLYDKISKDSEGNEFTGILKVASVGKEMVDNKPYYWIEIREDSPELIRITKFLAEEQKNFSAQDGFQFWGEIKRIIIQENSQTPEEIPAQHLKRYAPTFVESTKSRRFGNVKDQTAPTTTELPELRMTLNGQEVIGKGIKSSRVFSSGVNLGFLNLEDMTESTTEYYIDGKIPFGGLIKVVHTSLTTSVNKSKPDQEQKPPVRYENTLTLTQFGTSGAISQIIGEPVMKEILPLPFLKPSTKKSS